MRWGPHGRTRKMARSSTKTPCRLGRHTRNATSSAAPARPRNTGWGPGHHAITPVRPRPEEVATRATRTAQPGLFGYAPPILINGDSPVRRFLVVALTAPFLV